MQIIRRRAVKEDIHPRKSWDWEGVILDAISLNTPLPH